MELITIALLCGFGLAGMILSGFAIYISIKTESRLQGIEKSTHTMYPVDIGASDKLEKSLQKMGMGGKEDFKSDLEKNGFGYDSDADIEKLV